MGKKKKFDKKSSITFKLVHRSQRDPLVADERAPQHVLVPVNNDFKTRVDNDCKTRLNNNDIQLTKDQRIEEQRKFGIYFDDDYNYLQHLRDVNPLTEWQPIYDQKDDQNSVETKSNQIQFPSSLFASNVEEKEGLLNKGVLPIGPQLDWDPDLVAAMDEDFDFNDPNNQIDDDFVLQAEDIEDVDEDDEWEDMSDSEDINNEELDEENESTLCGDNHSLSDEKNQMFSDEETKSHFTNYSMSSSVIRRNENLRILDQRFETLYEKEYANECDIGALDFDQIEGNIDPNNSQLMATLIKEYNDSKNHKEIYENVDSKSFSNHFIDKDYERNEDLTEIEIYENSKKGDKDRFDCESILSTYSTLYNHPKVIRESDRHPKSDRHLNRVKINERTGLPIGVFEKPGLTAKKLAKLDAINNSNDLSKISSKSVRSSASRLSVLSQRSKNESSEERNARKSALKEYRRERRAEKKANKLAFNTENMRQNKEIINLQKNLTSVKLS
jgi:protein LTV1